MSCIFSLPLFLRWMLELVVLGGLRIVPLDIFLRTPLVSSFTDEQNVEMGKVIGCSVCC